MKKIFYLMKKVILWAVLAYIAIFLFLTLAEWTAGVGVDVPPKGVTYGSDYENVVQPPSWATTSPTWWWAPAWTRVSPTAGWNSPPEWAKK